MSRASGPQAFGFMLLIAGIVDAAEPPSNGTAVPPKVATLCKDCHGIDGGGIEAAGIPRIAGQTAGYLEEQLRDYANGSRVNPIMTNWAKQLSASELTDVAAYYSAVVGPPRPASADRDQSSIALRARGHQLAAQGDESRRVQACANCHGPEGVGVPQSAPYLAGQWDTYLTNALKAWQTGTRHNDPGRLMASVAARLTNADIEAVAQYYSSLAP